MTEIVADVAIIGSGFGGSLTALLCQRIGLRPVLLERGTHPRFAIGESSTPTADLVLRGLCQGYDLPRLLPLTSYGSWKRTYPDVACGLKRGFSYFHHRAGEAFAPSADHANELLVAANPDEENGDTHWFRAEVDHFLVREVQAASIPYFDRTLIESMTDDDPWRIVAAREGTPLHVRAGFVVDASGPASALASYLDIPVRPTDLRTHSRAVFSHFRGVRRWHDIHERLGGATGDHPFPCDAAALHHVFDGGWMWVLRFDNGITSAGFMLDGNPDGFSEDDAEMSPEDEWATLLRRFPSIAEQFAEARPVQPLQRTARLQRRAERAAGRNWAMLPHTAYFLDALHSAGNAHTLLGIERVVRILAESRDDADRTRRLEEYDRSLKGEINLLDAIIHGCYCGFRDFEPMVAFSMLYFAGATCSEHRRRGGWHGDHDGFLMAHDGGFRAAVERAYESVRALSSERRSPTPDVREFHSQVRELIAPYNLVGLADPAQANMYRFR